jgi:hypothetical protein
MDVTVAERSFGSEKVEKTAAGGRPGHRNWQPQNAQLHHNTQDNARPNAQDKYRNSPPTTTSSLTMASSLLRDEYLNDVLSAWAAGVEVARSAPRGRELSRARSLCAVLSLLPRLWWCGTDC